MKYDVFISYSRKDKDVADKICSVLDRNKISYFIDRQGISGGSQFISVIVDAIDESSIFLYLASENSYASVIAQKEVGYAVGEGYQILPYIVDGSILPKKLRLSFADINWRTIEQHPIDTVLLSDIRMMLGRDDTALSTDGLSADEIKQRAKAMYEGSSELSESASRDVLTQAMALVLPLAEAGDPEAMYMVGDMHQYYNWDGYDDDLCLEWWRKAADAGSLEAMYHLADEYYYSDDVEEQAKGVRLFGLAAGKGHVGSMLRYANSLLHGYYIDKNPAQAIKWYEAAAKQGSVEAMKFMYVHYMGLERSRESVMKAIEWYLKATEAHKEAGDSAFIDYDLVLWQSDLMYEGRILPLDKHAALSGYKACAMEGYDDAILKYARMLHRGDGVPADVVEAKEWYQKIADRSEEAREALAEIGEPSLDQQFASLIRKFSASCPDTDKPETDNNPRQYLTMDDIMKL